MHRHIHLVHTRTSYVNSNCVLVPGNNGRTQAAVIRKWGIAKGFGAREGGRECSVKGPLLFAVLAKYYRGDQIRDYAMGGALCGKHGA